MKVKAMDDFKPPKVFCVGPYKTGTTSLHRFFQSYNLKSYHGPRWVNWCKSRKAHRLDCFDCLSDGMKHPLDFLHDRYPDAKFIYSKRALRDWMISRHAHRRRKSKEFGYYLLILIGIKGISGIRYQNSAVRKWPKDYHDHERRVFSFFKDKPGKLLVVDVFNDSPEDVGRQIHDFLELPGEPHQLPKENVAPNKLRTSSEQAIDRVLNEMDLE